MSSSILIQWFGFFLLMAYQPSLVILCKRILARWEEKVVRNFLKGVSSKVNVIARLEFEHAYFEVTDQLIKGFPSLFYINKYRKSYSIPTQMLIIFKPIY